jgi:hypothetical protein
MRIIGRELRIARALRKPLEPAVIAAGDDLPGGLDGDPRA